LYVESTARSVEFYRRIFGFEPLEPGEPLNDETHLCPMRAGDRSVLLLFKKGATADTDASGAIHIAFGIARSDLAAWERWLNEPGISIELRKTWKYGGEALYLRDPDGHLLEEGCHSLRGKVGPVIRKRFCNFDSNRRAGCRHSETIKRIRAFQGKP